MVLGPRSGIDLSPACATPSHQRVCLHGNGSFTQARLNLPPPTHSRFPDTKVRATKCGLISEVMHVATLLQFASGKRRNALAVSMLRKDELKSKTVAFLLSTTIRKSHGDN